MKRLLAIFLLFPSLAFGVIATTAQWDVRTGGSDNNGGGFDSAVSIPGANYSQQNAAQVTYTDLTIGATTTNVTSAGFPFATCTSGVGYCGNLIHILSAVSGTCTVGWYEVVSTSTTTATLDRSAGTSAAVCNATLGGSLADMFAPIKVGNTIGVQASNTVWVQSGTYTITTTQTATTFNNPIYFIGYNATHGDNGTAPLITTSTNSVNMFTAGSASNYNFQNMTFSNTATTRGTGFSGSSVGYTFFKCTLNGFSTAISSVGYVNLINSLVENSTGVQINGVNNVLTIQGSQILNGGSHGIEQATVFGPADLIEDSVIANNAGDGLDISTIDGSLIIRHSDFVGNTASGILIAGFGAFSTSVYGSLQMTDTLFDDNGAFGANLPVLPFTQPLNQYNAYYNNTSGARNNLPAGVGDVVPTAEPLTNPSGGDFSLNSTSGGGPTLKGVGWPGLFPNGSTTGHLDIGAVQSAGTTTIFSNFGDSH